MRQFAPEDADSLSRLIVENLRRVNVRDYSAAAIEAMVPFYTPAELIEKARQQYMIVCVDGDDVIGTAALDGNKVRNVFVAVDRHRQGIGRLMMDYLESHAREQGLTDVYLHASPSAEGFYAGLGYRTVARIDRELNGNPAPLIKMEKQLLQPSK